jgi:hypothetical protein
VRKVKRHRPAGRFAGPLNIYLHPNIGIRLTPTWRKIDDNEIRNYDGSLANTLTYFAARIGYRSIRAGGEVLQGPYAGFSMYY